MPSLSSPSLKRGVEGDLAATPGLPPSPLTILFSLLFRPALGAALLAAEERGPRCSGTRRRSRRGARSPAR
eukprot:14868852-Alexandrium_andersonii.AAC.1